MICLSVFFCCKQKTAYDMRISDWSSDVCSSDLHDSNSLFKFEEHDIFLPMMVLEELDHQKKGMSEVARNARQVSRFLDGLVAGAKELEKGVELDTLGNQEALGKQIGRAHV